MHFVQIVVEDGLAAAAKREVQRFGGDEGVAVAISSDPAADTKEAWRARLKRALPPCVKSRKHRDEDVTKVGEGGFDLIRHIKLVAAKRAGLPKQCDLAQNCLLDHVAAVRLLLALVAIRHQCGDPIAV